LSASAAPPKQSARRLLAAWETAGEGVTSGTSHYGVKLSSTPQTDALAYALLYDGKRRVHHAGITALKTRDPLTE